MRGEDFVRIGYPTGDRSGSTISSGRLYNIPKNAAHSEEAWDFIRSLITEKPEFEQMGRGGVRMLRS